MKPSDSKPRALRVAVVGATGLVGSMMLRVLEEREFPVEKLIPVASDSSVAAGREVRFRGELIPVVSIQTALDAQLDVALFSAGGALSLAWGPRFAEAGITTIDNSSAWRMHPNHKLVVPEVNGHVLGPEDLLIANPNCTTAQLVMALKPLHDRWGIVEGIVNTYQSVTGSGVAGMEQLQSERAGSSASSPAYPHPIDRNVIPHCDVFDPTNGFTREEMKVWHETQKILGDDQVAMRCTAVRVPVEGGHSESVYVELKEVPADLGEVREVLGAFPGVELVDEPENLAYPMPLMAHGRDEVFVGRIRRDLAKPHGLHLWIVADNLRKGAATNAVQIAEYLRSSGRWS